MKPPNEISSIALMAALAGGLWLWFNYGQRALAIAIIAAGCIAFALLD